MWTAHAVHVPPGPAANRWTAWQQRFGGAELTYFKSAERQFLLILLNQLRQMQPIHNSGNLWILRWALTYIIMTSKHNFRGNFFPLFPMTVLFLSIPVPVSSAAAGFHPLLPPWGGNNTFVATILFKKLQQMRVLFWYFSSFGLYLRALWWYPL